MEETAQGTLKKGKEWTSETEDNPEGTMSGIGIIYLCVKECCLTRFNKKTDYRIH